MFPLEITLQRKIVLQCKLYFLLCHVKMLGILYEILSFHKFDEQKHKLNKFGLPFKIYINNL